MKQELDYTNARILKYLKTNPKQTAPEITKVLDIHNIGATTNRLRYLEYIGLVKKEYLSEINGTNGSRSNHIYWYTTTRK